MGREENIVIRVLLIYDSALVRDGLKALLHGSGELQVVAEAATIAEGIDKLAVHEPHVVLMDVSLQILNALDASALIRRHYPHIAIMMLCEHCGNQPCFRPQQGRADLLVSKTHIGGEQLVEALRNVSARRSRNGEASRAPVAWVPSPTSRCGVNAWGTLSAREREVLKMVAEGKTSSQIARMVKLSPKTVQTYRARIMSKLKVRGVPELIKYAVQFGLTSLR